MLDQSTGREAELRQMLVATAAAAPTRRRRWRPFIPLTIAFVAAGAITGGAVSAAALNSPAPVSTVSVESIARTFVHDDTQLFGTPFILSGQGETNVILGSAPAGATDIAIAFNCLDAASYEVRVDGEFFARITCDENSTERAGSASFYPLDPTGDGEHRVSIATGKSDRYVLWASWAAPVTTEPSAAQQEALADGTVTEAEYRDGFARYQQCMTDAGYPLGSVDDAGTVISYVTSGESVQSGVEGRCYDAEFGDLDSRWQVANE